MSEESERVETDFPYNCLIAIDWDGSWDNKNTEDSASANQLGSGASESGSTGEIDLEGGNNEPSFGSVEF